MTSPEFPVREEIVSHPYQKTISPLVDSSGEVVGTRIKIEYPTANLDETDLFLSPDELTRLQAITNDYLRLYPEFKDRRDLADAVHWGARNKHKFDTDAPHGAIDAFLGEMYARKIKDFYEYILDLTTDHRYYNDAILYEKTVLKVPDQSLTAYPNPSDPSIYTMTNVNPFKLKLSDTRVVDAIMISKIISSGSPLPVDMRILIQLLGMEGFFPVDVNGKPLLNLAMK